MQKDINMFIATSFSLLVNKQQKINEKLFNLFKEKYSD